MTSINLTFLTLLESGPFEKLFEYNTLSISVAQKEEKLDGPKKICIAPIAPEYVWLLYTKQSMLFVQANLFLNASSAFAVLEKNKLLFLFRIVFGICSVFRFCFGSSQCFHVVNCGFLVLAVSTEKDFQSCSTASPNVAPNLLGIGAFSSKML